MIVLYSPRARAAIERRDLSLDVIASALADPDHVMLDPSGAGRTYTVERRQLGSVIVVVTYTDPDNVYVCNVYIERRGVRTQGQGARKAAAGATGSTLPATYPELRQRIARLGMTIEPGTRHDKVIDRAGRIVTTIASTASDHRSLANCWTQVTRHVRESRKAGKTAAEGS
jgi:hypothetical protein